MKINRDEILDALHTLKEVCTAQGDDECCCHRCPLSDGTDCMVEGAPQCWELNEPEKDWRAFK